jgi:4a-hydroxytetrahydrobiopterin dehydratase
MKNSLSLAKVKELMHNIPEWKLSENGTTIYRDFTMKNFTASVDLIDKIAKIAEQENHHPDIHLTGYRQLRIELTTHEAEGLSELDFKEAGRIDELPAELRELQTNKK